MYKVDQNYLYYTLLKEFNLKYSFNVKGSSYLRISSNSSSDNKFSLARDYYLKKFFLMRSHFQSKCAN